MRRARLIYNPTAGRELVSKRLPELLDRLENAGLEASCRATYKPWDAVHEAYLAAERGFDIVIAAGGDGTVHEVVNGIVRHPNPPQLGIIPGGTTNDLARTLQLPKDIGEACQVIATGKARPMDIGKYGERYFISCAAAGIFTEVTYEAPSRLKTVLGPIAYYAKAIEKLGALHKPFSIDIESQGKKQTFTDVMLLVVANGKSIGGFEKLAPAADVQDGKLDVMIIPKVTIPDLLQIVSLASRGEHLLDDRVIYFQTDHFHLSTNESVRLNLDGEWGGDLNGEIRILPNHLQVYSP